MSGNRPFALSIAGFDPCGGAGVLADVKTFEQYHVCGLSIITANTIQTENEFIQTEWISIDFVLKSIETLFATYDIKVVKIGIISSLKYLEKIVSTIKKVAPTTKIVWDTILKSSTEFIFLTIENQSKLIEILKQIDLITPNYNEIVKLNNSNESEEKMAMLLSEYCAVLLKGGHNSKAQGTDYLFVQKKCIELLPNEEVLYEKHGSGCILSSAIAANIALGNELTQSCQNAKIYIEKILNSNPSLLSYHHD